MSKNKVLIAGPWVSELGWELMVWQAAVRWKRAQQNYRETYVITFKGREALYEGCRLSSHQLELKTSSFGIGKVTPSQIKEAVDQCVQEYDITDDYDLFTPNDLLTFRSRFMRKLFRAGLVYKTLCNPGTEKVYDIGFHFRNFSKKGDIDTKNTPPEQAEEIVNWAVAQGLKVCCLGLPGYAYRAHQADDRLCHTLADTITTLNQCHCVAGGSSAPLHLACLCEIPIVVWVGPPFNAQRYRTSWNPFSSPVEVVSEATFTPTTIEITHGITQMLKKSA